MKAQRSGRARVMLFARGILLGAGLQYLFDRDRGARRRAFLRDKAVRAGHQLTEGIRVTARDMRNRTVGAAATVQARLRREEAEVPDAVLIRRVRAVLGRAVSHPGSIGVTADHGRVTLNGPILAREIDTLLRCITRVRGVREVVSALEPHASPGDIPGLQGGRPRRPRSELLQENWAPTIRLGMGTAGAAAVAWGLRTRSWLGTAAGIMGLGALARALTNLSIKRLVGVGAGRRAIDLQKTITVHAPVARVWELWSNFENFPHFMAHLREVRKTSEGRSHWVAAGPAGVPIEWDAVITEWIPNEVIAWKSVEGSAVGNAGIVRFQPGPGDTTVIDIRMSYNPPGGAIGHVVATLFGTDPKRALDDDMVRLKSLLEDGKTTAHAAQARLDELQPGPAPAPVSESNSSD